VRWSWNTEAESAVETPEMPIFFTRTVLVALEPCALIRVTAAVAVGVKLAEAR
jgi:hypothetical protein